VEPGRGFEWSPGLGDPSLVGWLTVFAYFGAAVLCLQAFKAQKRTPDGRAGAGAYLDAARSLGRMLRRHGRRFGDVPAPARRAAWWLSLAVLFALLGVNKQLDLQTLLTETGRWVAYGTGWYEERRGVQILFVTLVATGAVLAVMGLAYLARDQLRTLGPSIVGLAMTLGYVVIRAASFHRVDVLIHTEIFFVELNWVFELSGIGVVAWSARRARRLASPRA
jgi:hypothetical protein